MAMDRELKHSKHTANGKVSTMARDRLAELNSNTPRDYGTPRNAQREYERRPSFSREYERPSSPREFERPSSPRNDRRQDSTNFRNDNYQRSEVSRQGSVRNTVQRNDVGRRNDFPRDARSDVRSDVSRDTSRTAYSKDSRPSQDNYNGSIASKGPSNATSYSDKVDEIQEMFGLVSRKLRSLESLQSRSITVVGERETTKITKDISMLSDEISDLISDIKTYLSKLSNETKSIQGPEKQSRKFKESNLAKELISIANEFSSIQNAFKEKCRQRMEREIKIARPNATPAEVEQIMNDPQGSVFQKETLGRTRHVLNQLQNRHKELEQLEASIEELAQIFYDMQQQQETIDVTENYINDVSKNLEDGSGEITKAIVYRQKSRKKLWCLLVFFFVLLCAGGAYAYYNFVYLPKKATQSNN
ncbi:Plasma membrane t-SNARE, secretory vesicle fusion [Terramyces sp. JEL0728]|nr:Plasma membrane t-SNARE, secretory vesicle fusion [Terramyces sp. JEL0728]